MISIDSNQSAAFSSMIDPHLSCEIKSPLLPKWIIPVGESLMQPVTQKRKVWRFWAKCLHPFGPPHFLGN